MMAKGWLAAAACAAILAGAPVLAADLAPPSWTTLGTAGGPVSNPTRSQPANLLAWDGQLALVDAGDGAVQQLAKAGVQVGRVRTLVLSHLHFDHTGGVAALLGLRWQTNAPGRLMIYGPPGTKALIDGLVASMQPGADAGYGLPGARRVDPATTVEVHELADGEMVALPGNARMTAVQNTHFSFAPGSPEDERSKSFSFRFDLGKRAIVYTGDTGPSERVVALGKGADMLVSEMIDAPATVAAVKVHAKNLDPQQLREMEQHLTTHHLSPEAVGEMARAMGVSEVVATHLSMGDSRLPPEAYAARIRKVFRGKVFISRDLARFN